MFRRNPRPGGGAPDPDLGLLTVDEAAALRSLVRSTLSELGYEPIIHPDHAVLDDGTILGFDSLVRTCLAEPRGRSRWPRVVRRHFTRLLDDTHGDDDEDEGTLVLRLAELASVDAGGLTFEYAPEPIPGLRQVLSIDRPDTVATLSDQMLAERTGPLGPLVDEGRENLRHLLRRSDVEVERLEHEGHVFWCAVGTDVFTASYALLLPEAVGRWLPEADLSDGVLFAVPFRHQLAFAVCSDRTAILDGLQMLPMFALSGFTEGVGPLSPHTFLWHDGEVTQVSRLVDDRIEVRPGAHLEALLADDGPV